MVSMMDILSGASRLIVDVRQTGSRPDIGPASPGDREAGQVAGHRPGHNRGGNRQANAALYRIVLVRLQWHPATKAYVERRTAEGKTKAEIIRCLKRYVARELYPILRNPAAQAA